MEAEKVELMIPSSCFLPWDSGIAILN